MVSDNLTQELQDRGLRLVNTTKRTYDANARGRRPDLPGQLWFFTSHRVFGYQNYLAGNWSNLTQNTPFYTPDLSRPAIHQQDNVSDGIRFTYQLSRKDKISAAWDFQHSDICLGCSPLVAPEATYLTKYADPELPAAVQVEPRHEQPVLLRSGRLDADLQLAESPETRSAGHLDPQRQHRLPLQRAARVESRPARRQPVQSARVAQLRHRLARVQGGLHDPGSLASRVVRRRRPRGRARRGPRGLYLPEQSAVADHAVRRAGDVRRTPEGEPRDLRPGSVDAAAG